MAARGGDRYTRRVVRVALTTGDGQDVARVDPSRRTVAAWARAQRLEQEAALGAVGRIRLALELGQRVRAIRARAQR